MWRAGPRKGPGNVPQAMRQTMNRIFSLCYWLFVGITSIPLFMVACLIRLATLPFDPRGRLLHRYTCWWAALYLRCLPGCRLLVLGRDKIPPNRALVFVANHQSTADIMALSALAVPFKWVSKKEVFRLPFVGWNMWLNRYVCVDRGNLRIVAKTMEVCRQWLRGGVPLMIFPEGHRSTNGELLKFHSGAFKLAAECNCAVFPIVVDGTGPIYRGWRVSAFPGIVTIRVLEPLTLAQFDGKVDRLREETFQRMRAALLEIRSQAVLR